METLDGRTYDLLFGIRRSIRYHLHRRRFYEGWNTLTVAAGVIGGSSAAATFAANLPATLSFLPIVLAAFVAVVSAIDLAVSTGRMANLHADLARRFIALEQAFAHGRDLKDAEHRKIVAARLEIEAEEPTPLRLLDTLCHYEILRSLGNDPARHPKVPFPRSALVHFCSQVDYALSLGPLSTAD